jgi:hypothetical protein
MGKRVMGTHCHREFGNCCFTDYLLDSYHALGLMYRTITPSVPKCKASKDQLKVNVFLRLTKFIHKNMNIYNIKSISIDSPQRLYFLNIFIRYCRCKYFFLNIWSKLVLPPSQRIWRKCFGSIIKEGSSKTNLSLFTPNKF